ncbi:TPA: hypothetical protein ACKP7H_002357 [Serratia marcescens]
MVQRYNPDYVMHAARFAPFARENEHGEFVKFSDYEVLKAERDALAVENQALIEGLRCIYTTALIAQDSGSEILYSWDFSNQPAEEIEMWISGAKETDAALAAIQAQGVERFAERMLTLANDPTYSTASHRNDLRDAGAKAMNYAAELREAK